MIQDMNVELGKVGTRTEGMVREKGGEWRRPDESFSSPRSKAFDLIFERLNQSYPQGCSETNYVVANALADVCMAVSRLTPKQLQIINESNDA